MVIYIHGDHSRGTNGTNFLLLEVAVTLQKGALSLDLVSNVGNSLLAKLGESLLSLIAGSGADLSLILKLGDNSAVLPADVLSELTEDGDASVGRKLKGAEGLRHNNALNLVKRRRNSLKNLQVSQSGGSTSGLVRKHSADSTPEHLGWGAEVEGTTTRVGVDMLLQKGEELH